MQSKWLTNVTLEVGMYSDEENYTYTKTDTFHLKVKDGKITRKMKSSESILDEDEQMDMKGLLAVPTFKEMHNHLDKTYYGLDWRSVIPVKNLKERLALEAKELQELAPTTKMRATKMIEEILSRGSTHIRTHVNVDPYIGLKNLEGILEALETFKGSVTAEIVAFPQHGLLNEAVPGLMREAMRSGATIVGGLDPAGIDLNIEKSLHTTMDLAHEFNADVDMHIHDGGHVGWYTIDKWVDMVEEAKWKNKSAISHAFSIGDVSIDRATSIAKRLQKNKIDIMSTIPITNTLPPIDLLNANGVNVFLGCDGYYDSWGPFGNGDVLEKVTTFCDITGKKDERSLSQSLKLITGGITPLDTEGNQVWPKENDPADFLFVDAESTAHLVARKLDRQALMVNGSFVFKN